MYNMGTKIYICTRLASKKINTNYTTTSLQEAILSKPILLFPPELHFLNVMTVPSLCYPKITCCYQQVTNNGTPNKVDCVH